jgi:hypothetical protein
VVVIVIVTAVRDALSQLPPAVNAAEKVPPPAGTGGVNGRRLPPVAASYHRILFGLIALGMAMSAKVAARHKA